MTVPRGAGADLAALERAGKPVSAAEALELVRSLATQVDMLHSRGRVHGAIVPAAVSWDGSTPVILSVPELPCVLGEKSVSREWLPPELRALTPLELPSDLDAARHTLRAAGTSLDPRQIDLYQLGALLCRLLTGESADAYLRSPRVKGKVPIALRPFLERALGSDGRVPFTDTAEFLLALNEVAHATGMPTHVATAASVPDPSEPADPPAEHDTTPSFVSSAQSPAPDTSVGPGQPSAAPRAADSSLPFTKLGHYEIVSRIGQGGMGDVYRGYERALDRSVAIKVLPAELARGDDFVRRFRAEATAAAKLIHPNIIQIYFIGEESGHHFFAMQYVEGESLADLLSRKGKLTSDETLAIVEQALSGLAAAHKQGLVHRDIKPGNILLDREHRRALLADFGLVKLLEASATGHTATGVIMGTVDYISPEQGRGQAVDGRSDLYSFGVLLYRMLSGRLPFEAENATALIFQHVYEQPPELQEIAPEIPAPLVRVIDRLLQKSPAERHQTADEVLADLRAFRSGRPLPSDERPPFAAPETGARPKERRTTIIHAPTFDDASLAPAGLPEIRPLRWWEQTRDRAVSVFRRHAPEALQQLQNTQQQVDGAVAEYARRQRALQQLADEALGVLAELRSQSEAHASAARRARECAAQCSDPEAARSAYAEELTAMRAADNLNRQVAEQQNQLESIRLNLAQVTATLETLRSQRDILRARLSAADAQRHLAAGGPARNRRAWATRLAAMVLIPLVTFVIIKQILQPADSVVPERREQATVKPAKSVSTTARVEPKEKAVSRTAEVEIERAVPMRQFAGHKRKVRDVAFSPDGNVLASASDDGTVRLWNPETAGINHTLEAHQAGASAVTFGPQGDFLVTAGRTSPADPRTLKIWDPKTGREIRTLEGRKQSVQSIAISNDGYTVAVIYTDGPPLSVWDVSKGSELRTIDPGTRPSAIAFNRDGTLLALGGGDAQVRLWDLLHNEATLVLKGHERNVTTVAFSADGASLFSGDSTGTVCQWDIPTGKKIDESMEQAGSVAALGSSPNNRRLVVAGREELSVWDLDIHRVRKILPGHRAACATFRPNTGILVSGGEDPYLMMWDARLEPLRVHQHVTQIDLGISSPPTAVAFSAPPVESRILVGGAGFVGASDLGKMQPLRKFDSIAETITDLDVGANTGFVASADNAGWVRVWNPSEGRLIREMNVNEGAPKTASPKTESRPIRSLSVAPTGTDVLVLTPWSMFVWNFANGQTSKLFKGAPAGNVAAGISPTGELAVTAGWDADERMGDLRLWNMKTGQNVRRLIGHEDSVHSTAFTQDGRMLASGGRGLIILWDVSTGEPIRRLTYSTKSATTMSSAAVTSLAFARDGRSLISGAAAAASLWDVQTGEELRRFAPEAGFKNIVSVGFTQDDMQVISLCRDGKVQFWPLSMANLPGK